jgi:hypothetical protein
MSEKTRSGEVRDALVNVLVKALKDGVPIQDADGNVHYGPPPAAILAVAKDYVKAFPPADLPTASEPKGVLAQFAKGLPFTPDKRAN